MPLQTATKLVQLFEASASLQSHTTVEMLLTFTVIARANEQRKGIHMKEIERLTGASSTNCSRVVQSIGLRHSKKLRPGLDLVVTSPDPDDVRAKLVFVTPKGRRFWSQLKSIMGEKDGNS